MNLFCLIEGKNDLVFNGASSLPGPGSGIPKHFLKEMIKLSNIEYR